VLKRLLPLLLAWPLLITPASAGGIDKMSAAGPGSVADFRLKGVLIAGSGRSAMVNDKIVREGDRIAGAEILSIEESGIRVRLGTELLTLRVGSTVAAARLSNSSTRPAITSAGASKRYGPVARGETLSQIAERHLVDNVTLNQLMVALFEANPSAFNNNINNLREGAVLRIPAREALRQFSAASAAAEVERQTDVWRSGISPAAKPVRLAKVIEPAIYGPVERGETLSGIAARLPRDGATIDQASTALFNANPEAFGGNMNILLEGAVLQIPDTLQRQTPQVATADIQRHTLAWRRETGPPAGEVLLSMNKLE
jgi:FimV-like protein